MVGRKVKKFVVPLARQDSTEGDSSLGLELLKIKEEVNDEVTLKVKQEVNEEVRIKKEVRESSPQKTSENARDEEMQDDEPTLATEERTHNMDEQNESVSVPNVEDSGFTSVTPAVVEESENVLTTIDAANLGLLWPSAELEVTVPLPVPKKRGRKPKAKNVPVDNGDLNDGIPAQENPANSEQLFNGFQESTTMRFPQSIVNGVFSIDMSNVGLKASTAGTSTAVEVTEEAGATGNEIGKKQRKNMRKKTVNGLQKPKRGRPKREKPDEFSSAPTTPVKKPTKRGRKTNAGSSAPSEPGVWSTKKILDYKPDDYRKLEQEEVLKPEDLVGFEDVEVYHFDHSEFEGNTTWWSKYGSKLKGLNPYTN